jgi:hypothetical protein
LPINVARFFRSEAMSAVDVDAENTKLLAFYAVSRSKSSPVQPLKQGKSFALVQTTPPVRYIRKSRPEKSRMAHCCQVEETKAKITLSSPNLELALGLTPGIDPVDNFDLIFEYLTLNDL